MQRVIASFGLATLSLMASYVLVTSWPEMDDAAPRVASVVSQSYAAEPVLLRFAD
jgi:hypothetical protein